MRCATVLHRARLSIAGNSWYQPAPILKGTSRVGAAPAWVRAICIYPGIGHGKDHRNRNRRTGADLRRRAAAARPFRSHAGRRPTSRTRIAGDIDLNMPILSAAMDTVTECAARHRHGAGRRHRRHPPQSVAGRAGRAGPPGQEVRIRHGGQPGHHRPRRDAGRCAAR